MAKVHAIKFVMQCQNWSEIVLPIALHKKLAKVVLKNGKSFQAPAVNWPDVYGVFFMQIYNPAHLPIEENDVVVDIGANIGVFTVYAASKTRNTVYAYEPSPSTFKALEQNIRVNGLSNVIPGMFAVSDKSGTELFVNMEVSTTCRLKTHVPGVTEKYFEDVEKDTIEVPTITLPEIMDKNNLEQIDFLKMDCEGAEGLILDSTPKSYLQRIRKISMEFHDGMSSINHLAMQKILIEAGFTTHLDWDPHSTLGGLYGWRD